MTDYEQVIESIKTHIRNAYTSAENKNATIPTNRNIENLSGTIDSIVVGGSGGGLMKYHVEQVVVGNSCTIAITEYTNQPNDNYLVGVVTDSENNTQKIYIVEV